MRPLQDGHRRRDGASVIYRRGSNDVDEHGKRTARDLDNPADPDDWAMWPLRHSDAYKEWQEAHTLGSSG